jgi:hypothetical protein
MTRVHGGRGEIGGREMTAEPMRVESMRGFLAFFHAAALIAVSVGAVGSLALMFYTGRRNNSRILMLLFTLWVVSPFVAAALADRISKAWSVTTRATLYGAMLVLSLGSLAVYAADASRAIRGKAAFVFLVVPPTSSLVAAAAVAIAALISARLARRGAL